HHFERGYSHLVLDSVIQAAKGYEQVAEKWEAQRTRRIDQPAANPAAPPADFDLEEAHAMILRGEAPKFSWRPWINELDFRGRDLKELASLAGLAALQRLDLGGTQVSDLAPLAGLAALQRLTLGNTQVSDLAPLAGLVALQRLTLGNTQVSDLAPLAGLAAFQRL